MPGENEDTLRQQEVASQSVSSDAPDKIVSSDIPDTGFPPNSTTSDPTSGPMSEIYIPRRRIKRTAKKRGCFGSVDLREPTSTFVEEGTEEDFPYGRPNILASWEVSNGQLNTIYRYDKTRKDFTFLYEILHLVDRIDLDRLYGLVTKHYSVSTASGAGLYLLGDLQVLYDSTGPDGFGFHVWKDNHKWKVTNWRFFPGPCVHVVETAAGFHVYMFFDKNYPMSVPLMERMLEHGLSIPPTPSGNTRILAEQLIKFIKQCILTRKAIASIP